MSVKREFGMRKSISTRSLTGETHSFAEILDLEAEKIVLFYLRVQGDLARKVWELREQHFRATAAKVRFLAHGGDDVGDSTLSLSQIDSLCERYRTLGQEVLDLLEYLDFNVLALRRIVRKHDKHFKSKMSAIYFDSRLSSGDGNNTALVQLVSGPTFGCFCVPSSFSLFFPSLSLSLSLLSPHHARLANSITKRDFAPSSRR